MIDDRLENEFPAEFITRHLNGNGHAVGHESGRRMQHPFPMSMAIFHERPTRQSYFGSTRPEPADHIGTVWFSDGNRNAKYHSRWVVEVYGREYAQEVKDLLDGPAQVYGVTLDVSVLDAHRREKMTWIEPGKPFDWKATGLRR